MCLITTQKVPFIADRDIVCYKAIRERGGLLWAIHQDHFRYDIDVLYETEIQEIKTGDRVFAFDRTDSMALGIYGLYDKKLQKMDELGYVSYGPGFHSAQKPERFVENDPDDIYECIIPAGSEYYVNPSGLMVSNKIKIVKKWKS